MQKVCIIGAVGAFFKAVVTRIICIMLSAILASQLKPILRRIGQKCPFRVNIARFAQMAT